MEFIVTIEIIIEDEDSKGAAIKRVWDILNAGLAQMDQEEVTVGIKGIRKIVVPWIINKLYPKRKRMKKGE